MNRVETIAAAAGRIAQEAEHCRDREQANRLRGIARAIQGAIKGADEAEKKTSKPVKGRPPALIAGDEGFEWQPAPLKRKHAPL